MKVLLACAMTEPDSDGKFAPASVVQPLSKLVGRKIKIANFSSHLKAFASEERGSILEEFGVAWGHTYRFAETKMLPYVIMQGINSGLIDDSALSILEAPEQPTLFPTASEPPSQQ